MDDLFAFLAFNPGWSWMIAGAVLFALDVMAPGFFLLWFGAAAAVVGLMVFVYPIAFTWQVLAFCSVSVLSVLAGLALWGGDRGGVSDKPLLNQRARQLIGRNFVLATPITSGQGRITAGDFDLERQRAGPAARGDGPRGRRRGHRCRPATGGFHSAARTHMGSTSALASWERERRAVGARRASSPEQSTS